MIPSKKYKFYLRKNYTNLKAFKINAKNQYDIYKLDMLVIINIQQ